MAEWLYEAGIGEARAALVEGGAIVEAAIESDDVGLRVGTVARVRLIDRATGLVRFDDGAEALLARAAPGVTQGATLTVAVTREAVAEPGRVKLAKAVPSGEPPVAGPDLLARLHELQAIDLAPAPPGSTLPRRKPGLSPTLGPAHRLSPGRGSLDDIGVSPIPICHLAAHQPDALEAAGWSELLEEARTGDIAFDGGMVRMWPTPAMTLFDIDGSGPLDQLAIRAAVAVARAIRRHGIGGSIGIDFPTLGGKAPRQAVADAFDAAMAWAGAPAFERTTVNGFGFLQLVRPRPRMSLPERWRADPAGAAARAVLRRLEREPPGAPLDHRFPPVVRSKLRARPDWLAELARRTGVTHRLESE